MNMRVVVVGVNSTVGKLGVIPMDLVISVYNCLKHYDLNFLLLLQSNSARFVRAWCLLMLTHRGGERH